MTRLKELRQSDILSHWVDMDYLPRWSVLLMDLLIVFVAFVVSYIIGSNLLEYDTNHLILPIWAQAIILMVVQTIFFWVFHTYSGILRYSTFVDVIKVSVSVLTTGVLLIFVNIIVKQAILQIPFLNTVLLIYIFVAITLLFAWRVIIKTVFEYISHQKQNVQKVLIYGTQSAGLSIAKMLQANMDSQYRPCGFITDYPEKYQHNLLGLQVYKRDEKLIQIMKEKEINNIIVSPLKMRSINMKELGVFIENNIRILTTPYFSNYDPQNEDKNDKQHIGAIESIKVEDLLERPIININTENVRNILSNKVVLITGAAGSIGSEIVKQVATHTPSGIILLEMAESPLHDLMMELKPLFPTIKFIHMIADVRNLTMLEPIFKEYNPDVVFHAAAYKHVPLMEDFPPQAILTNVLGTKNIADLFLPVPNRMYIILKIMNRPCPPTIHKTPPLTPYLISHHRLRLYSPLCTLHPMHSALHDPKNLSQNQHQCHNQTYWSFPHRSQ